MVDLSGDWLLCWSWFLDLGSAACLQCICLFLTLFQKSRITQQGYSSQNFAMEAATSSRSLFHIPIFSIGYIIINNYQKHGLFGQAISPSESSRGWDFSSPSVIHIQQVALCLDKWFLSVMDEVSPEYYLSLQLTLNIFVNTLLCHNLRQFTRKLRLYEILILCSDKYK